MNPEEAATTIPSGCDHINAGLAAALDWCAQYSATVLFHKGGRVFVKGTRDSTEASHSAPTFMEAVAVCRKALAASEG